MRAYVDLTVEVGRPIEVGTAPHGMRRVIPILGGRCTTPDWSARVLAGGADFQLIVNERMARLEARYVLETDAGDRIYVHNDAIRTAAPGGDGAPRPRRAGRSGRGLLPLRAALRVRRAAALAWIGERVFVGVGVRRPDDVVMRFFEVQ